MTKKTKGRAGGHQATPKTTCKRNSNVMCSVRVRKGAMAIPKTTFERNSNGIFSRVKAAIVTLAVWGWFPIGLAERINRSGGPRDE